MRLLALVTAASIVAWNGAPALADATENQAPGPPTARFDDWVPSRIDTARLIDPYPEKQPVPGPVGEPKDPYASVVPPAAKVDPLLLVDPYAETTGPSGAASVGPGAGTLRVIRPPAFEGEVFIDSTRVADDAPLRVAPGEHAVQIEPAGRAAFVVYVDVAPGTEERLRFSLTTTKR